MSSIEHFRDEPETDMSALSLDLRKRIFNYAMNHSIRDTAQVFDVSPNTVYQLQKLYYETGGLVPRPKPTTHAHAVSSEGELYLQVLLAEDVDLTLDQLCARYEETYGVRVGRTTMHNTLKRLNFTRKKNGLRSETPQR
jgi:transposase